jgi:hypothetical protein
VDTGMYSVLDFSGGYGAGRGDWFVGCDKRDRCDRRDRCVFILRSCRCDGRDRRDLGVRVS